MTRDFHSRYADIANIGVSLVVDGRYLTDAKRGEIANLGEGEGDWLKWLAGATAKGEKMAEWIVEAETLEELENGFYAIGVELVRCRDCIHKPTGSGVNHDIEFPEGDYKCPCQCSDYWYSWMPKDDWFCGNGERREE